MSLVVENKGTRTDRRVWLGWNQPILHSTVEYLAGRYLSHSSWDMDGVICVFPSSLAGRRLAQLLAEKARKDSLVLRPPEIITIGELPEKLYEAKFPFAGDVEQILSWTKVLRSTSSKVLEPLLVEVPSSSSNQPWIELASLLSSLHRELSSDLTMFTEVASKLQQDQSSEAARWHVLAKLQRSYLDELSKSGRWDIQTARMFAIEHQEPKSQNDIVVIGAVDLNEAQRAFIKSVINRVDILVGAPKSWSSQFDLFGALISGKWQDIPVDFTEGQLLCCSTADEAAEEVVRQLAMINRAGEEGVIPSYSAQQITIGVPDSSMISIVTERLHRHGVVGRNGGGVKATEKSPIRLLEGIVEYLEQGSYEAFAALIRLPAVAHVLESSKRDTGSSQEHVSQNATQKHSISNESTSNDSGSEESTLEKSSKIPLDFIQQIDTYYQATLIQSVKLKEWPAGQGLEALKATIEAIDDWLRPLRLPPIPLNQWAQPIRSVFSAAFKGVKIDLDTPEGDALIDATTKTNSAIEILSDLPEAFVVDATIREAVSWILRQLDKATIAPLVDPNSIEMIGWLDLTLDDAPVLLLTGIHDGTVPESVNADAFLPNRIRTELGLMDNARRYARDCYAMQVLLHSRNLVRVITNHASASGEPQTPSRLLLAVDANRLANRVLQLIEPEKPSGRVIVRTEPRPRPIQSDLPIPFPLEEAAATVERMSPSDFESYLACPYRFYLSRILRLQPIDDRKMELEANDFGNLIHETVARIITSPVAESTVPKEIQDWLLKTIDEVVLEKYGNNLPPAIIVQIEQARQRLVAFAPLQAERAAQGWKIVATEVAINPADGAEIDVDGTPMPLIGRIDRIDYHPVQKQIAIWDYKTGDKTKKPKLAHYSDRTGWKNLQLPIYRHLIKRLKADKWKVAKESISEALKREIFLGYINIPKSSSECKFEVATFGDSLLEAADKEAAEVIRRIRKNEFWPPRYDNVTPWDEFSAICQNDVARRWSAEEENRFRSLEDPMNQPISPSTITTQSTTVDEDFNKSIQRIVRKPLSRSGTDMTQCLVQWTWC